MKIEILKELLKIAKLLQADAAAVEYYSDDYKKFSFTWKNE